MLRKLASQTAVYGISAILSKFLNYLLTPYLTVTVAMPDSVYGEMSLYYSIIPFANVILTMGLTTGYFRFADRCENAEQKRVLFTTAWMAVSVLSVLFFALLSSFSGTLNYSDASWYMVVTAALIMVDNINALPLASLREQGHARYYTIVNVASVVVNVACCVGLYQLIPGAKGVAGWVMVANLIASLVSTAMLMPSAMKMFIRKISFGVLRNISKYSFPLMIAGVMGVASDFIDRQLLNELLPDDIAKAEVGIYSAVAKIAALMVIFRSIYALGAEPFFLQNFKKEDFKCLNAEALKFFAIAGLGIFLVITLFEDVFVLLVGADYRSGMSIVPLLLMANFFSGILVNLSFWYKQADRNRVAIYVTLTGLALTLGLNYWLIPVYGYDGSAWARLAATFAMCVVSYVMGQIYYKIPYNMPRIAFYFGVAITIYFFADSCTATLSPLLRYCSNILLILCYILIAIKLEWKKLKL